MRSLATRVALLQQIAIAVAIVAFALLALWVTDRMLHAQRRAFVTETAQRLAGTITGEFDEDPDTLAMGTSLLDDAREVGLAAEVRDPSGVVIASSVPGVPPGTRGDPNVLPHDAADAELARPETILTTARNPDGFRVTIVGTDTARGPVVRAIALSLLIAGVPILLVSLVLGRWIVARALRPLSIMATRAESISVERHPRSLGGRTGLEETDQLAASFDRLLERLDDASRAERRLTADASHELRTPLTVLAGELDLLVEQVPADSEPATGLRRAAEQVAAMSALTDAILLLHRSPETAAADHGDELLNLADLLRETLAEVRLHHAGRDEDIVLAAPDEVLIAGRSVLLAAGLRNVVDNALKFTSHGQVVNVSLAEADGEALIVVEDAGPGVPEVERERVFDPFYRGSEARVSTTGFGLGLPILRRVVRAHSGDVRVASSTLGGARFEIRLPRATDTQPPGH